MWKKIALLTIHLVHYLRVEFSAITCCKSAAWDQTFQVEPVNIIRRFFQDKVFSIWYPSVGCPPDIRRMGQVLFTFTHPADIHYMASGWITGFTSSFCPTAYLAVTRRTERGGNFTSGLIASVEKIDVSSNHQSIEVSFDFWRTLTFASLAIS